jgi:hypothetical protein
VACAFLHKQEKFLITLTGEPDWKLICWNWDLNKMMATIDIGITSAPPQSMNCFKISFNMFEPKEFKLVVTGPNVYKYYKLTQDFNEFQADHT